MLNLLPYTVELTFTGDNGDI